ncbi:MAG: flagellar biosynthesis protein FlhF [Cyclobacteriaceae bacterium]
MAIRKFDARTMAEGMRLVREMVGPDAMIVQSLKRNGRVELYVETQAPTQALTRAQTRVPSSMSGSPQAGHVDHQSPRPQIDTKVVEDFQRARRRMLDALDEARDNVAFDLPEDMARQREPAVRPQANAASPVPIAPLARGPLDPLDFSSFDEILSSIKREVPSRQGADGDTDPITSTDPITGKANIKAVIERLQFQPRLAAQLAPCRRIDEFIEALAAQIDVVDVSNPPRGIKAFVGPAGSGKTTTLTKLVTRHVMQFGADSIAIIGCDRIRAGAQEQLSKVATLLEVPFLQVSGKLSLSDALNKLSHRRLVMIDMPGISMRAPELAAELACLDDSGFEIDRYLTLQANLQADVMQMAVSVYGLKGRTQVILTKLDESCSLGPALDLLAATRLPLAYLTDGPHVPEDLVAARVKPLIQQALALLRGKFAKQAINDLTNRGGTEMVSGL